MLITKENNALSALSLLDCVERGKPYTFICYHSPDSLSWWQRPLKKGFQHCFVIHWNGYVWLRHEKLKGYHYTDIILTLDGYGLGLENIKPYFEKQGYICQNVEQLARDAKSVRAVFTLSNCSEYVKDFLGIKARLVFTPYQLFKLVNKGKYYGNRDRATER